MKTKSNTVAAVMTAGMLVLVAGSQAHALSVSTGVTGNLQAAGATSSSAQASGAASVGVGVNAGVGANATGGAAATGNSSTSAAAELLINGPVSIATTADLNSYDDLVVKARPAVTAINVDSNNNIAIAYSQPAKFFGIFPTTITGTVMVDAQGNAKIELPWWAMFYAKNTAATQASVTGAVAGSGADFSAGAQADAQAQLQNEARVIDAVTGALQAQATADASTSVTAQ
jgi:hypothetical protein